MEFSPVTLGKASPKKRKTSPKASIEFQNELCLAPNFLISPCYACPRPTKTSCNSAWLTIIPGKLKRFPMRN